MRVLIADRLPDACVEELRRDGHEVTVAPEIDSDGLPSRVDHEVLVVRSTRVTADAIEGCARLTLIVRAGSGTNTIDTDAAASRGVFVCNVPGENAVAVAELTIGLLIAVDRRIPDNVADLRAGRWNKAEYQRASGLFGRRIGIVGLGDIGLAVAERVAALGMRIRALDRPDRPPRTAARIRELGIELVGDLSTFAGSCDVLSFHVPLTEATRSIVDADLLAHVRPGAIILNTARGELVDEDALLAAMDEKGVRAGLDVYRDEPTGGRGEFESLLARHPNVYGTHHIGASTEQAQEAIAREVVRIIRGFAEGEVTNCVNLETNRLGSCTLLVRHLDRVGALSQVLNVLKEANVNIEQMDNEIFVGAEAACATMRVSGAVDDELRARIAAIPDVIHVSVSAGS